MNHFFRAFVLCVCVVAVISACSVCVGASSGDCGADVFWFFDENTGAMVINGTGPMESYHYIKTPPWSGFKPSILSLVVEEGVTEIGENAFLSCYNLASVTFPSTLESIGTNSFMECYNLTSVRIPSSLTSIGGDAFLSCNNLSFIVEDGNPSYFSFDGALVDNSNHVFIRCPASKRGTFLIPDNVTSIERHAFSGCNGLTSIVIPSTVTLIGGFAFSDCNGLLNLTIPFGVEIIDGQAFQGCTNLINITIPSSVTDIGISAFEGCTNLQYVSLSSNIKTISTRTFYGCASLKDVNIPSNVQSIGDFAFYGCSSLTNVTIPANVSSIASGAFGSCGSLLEINVESGNTHYTVNESVLFSFEGPHLVQCPGGKTGPYTIRDGVVSIRWHAFDGCAGLTSVSIPESVTSIGSNAFRGCIALLSVNIPSNVTTIESDSFLGCSSLVEVILPANLTYVRDNVFDGCIKLANLTLPDRVQYIGKEAFANCTSLTSITIPASVKSVGTNAFSLCYNLKEINVDGNSSSFESFDGVLFKKGMNSLVQYPCGKESNTYDVPGNVTSIEPYAFYSCEKLESISILGEITSVGYSAFMGCSNLVSVRFSSGLDYISADTFHGCKSLKSVNIPPTVQWIYSSAFAGCSSLSSITIPANVSSIDRTAFEACSGLISVLYQGYSDPEEFYGTTFNTCKALELVCVPPNYTADKFCGRTDLYKSDSCEEVSAQINRCFGVSVDEGDGSVVIAQRENSTAWVNQTNGCMNFTCDNKTGPAALAICKSDDEVNRMCVDGACVEERAKEEIAWIVEIDIEKTDAAEVNTTELKAEISDMCHLDPERITIATEVDENGQVVRVLVFVDSKDSAQVIAELVNGISSASGECGYDNTLCRSKRTRVVAGTTFLAEASHIDMNILFTIVAVLLMVNFIHPRY